MSEKRGPTNTRVFGQMVKQAVVQEDYARLRKILSALLAKAEDGDLEAIKIVADRLDGKAAQDISLLGDEQHPLVHKIVREIVRTTPQDG